MAKKSSVKITGVDKISKNFGKFLRATEKDQAMLTDIAITAREQIIKRTQGRLEEYKQPDLSESWVKRRKRLIEVGNGSNLSAPNRSNLTLSSQLLNALTFRLNLADGVMNFFLKDYRKPYRGVKGGELENKTNTEIKADLAQQGREFMFISERLKAQLQTRIIRNLRKRLSIFKKLKK
jgi:hypothetical protein